MAIEGLEQRQLLTGGTPTVTIGDIIVNLNTPGPTAVTGELNPGNALAAYRIDGTAGEQLQFHSVSTSSTAGDWQLVGEDDREVAGNQLGSDFTATLTTTGPYYLELIGNTTGAINYAFQVTDQTSYPPIAAGGFDTPQSGTLAAGASTNFTFTAPAGLPVFYNSLVRDSNALNVRLADPNGQTVFSSYYGDNDQGPDVLTASGTYTLTLTNASGGTLPYDFDMLALPQAATSIATGPTETVGGTLNPGYATRIYSFAGAQGERLFLDNNQKPGDPVDDELIAPDGSQVFDIGSYSEGGPLSLTESGTYYLLVNGESASPINYQVRLTDTAYAPLTFGSPTDGSFSTPAASDVYTFTGTAGEQTFFHWLSQSNGPYGVSWQLDGPDNRSIAGGSGYSDLSATLPADGTYTLVVSNNFYQGASSYSFEGYVGADSTSALKLGSAVSGTIVNPGDEANYTFNGAAGERIYFDNLGFADGLSASLTGPTGATLFSDEYGIGNSDQGPFTLTQSGTYTLTVVGSYDYYGVTAATGGYAFDLSDIAAAPAMPTGAAVGGTLATGLNTDLYRFSGTAGERIFFQGQQDSPSDGAYATLYDPADNQVSSFYLEGNAEVTLALGGTYLLAVAGQSPSNASVAYGFEAYQDATTTSPLPLGSEVTGTIADPGDDAVYTFAGVAGQRVYFDNLGFADGLSASLTGPAGYTAFNDDYGIGDSDQGPYTLPATGTYALTVLGSDGYYGVTAATGGYAFTLSDIASAPATPTGTAVGGTLATGLNTDLYRFSGTAGERIFFQGQQDSPSDGAYATLYDPANNRATSFYLESNAQVTLGLGGTYVLAVAGQSPSNASVAYGFEAYQDATTSSALTLGVAVSGTIVDPGDEAVYTFSGLAGQRVYFDNLGFADGLSASLTGPAGYTAFNDYYGIGDSDQGPYTLPATGTYALIVVGSYDYYGVTAATGGYSFDLSDIATAPAMPTGTAIGGTLAGGLSTDLYQFSGTAGERIFFQGQQDSPSDGAYATLYDPADNQVSSFYLEGNAEVTLALGGTYLLAVAGQSPSNASVAYGFEAYQDATTTSPLPLGSEVTGTIADPGDDAVYTFAGVAGQRVYFDNLGFADGLSASLTGPAGYTAFNDDYGIGDSDQGPYTLPATGTYALTVLGSDGYYGVTAATGGYAFTLSDIASAPATPTGARSAGRWPPD